MKKKIYNTPAIVCVECRSLTALLKGSGNPEWTGGGSPGQQDQHPGGGTTAPKRKIF